MYPIPYAMEVNRTKNEGLRTYSRLEYGTPDGTWLLVAAGLLSRAPRRPKSLRRTLRRWLRRAEGLAAPGPRAEPVVDP